MPSLDPETFDLQQAAAIAWPLLVALVISWLVRRSLLALGRRAAATGDAGLRLRIAHVIALPAAVALPLFFLSLAVAAMPLQPEWIARIQHWLAVGGLLSVTWLLMRAVGAVERRILRQHPVDVADNLEARRIQTQTRVVGRIVQIGLLVVGVAIALMTFPAIRQVGTTLLASAGIIGVIAGIAAQPVFGNLVAGLQIALSQPIRIDDVVIVEGEWGRIEEITATYVVVRIWDERRMVVPLQWFIQNPFENWTRTSAELLGTSFLWLDYRTPMGAVREELRRICESDERWDGRVCVAQVTETDRHTIQVRLLVSARNSGDLFDLRCVVRERMICFLEQHYPDALPRMRADVARHRPPRPDAVADATAPAEVSSPGAEHVTGADQAARRERAATD